MEKIGVEAFFEGTDGAIRFGSAEMMREFQRVAHSWPCREGAGPLGPFVEIRPTGARWSIHTLRPEPRHRTRNVVNGICDLVVDLNWSRLRQDTRLMCMHAAGIEMGSSLVVFPSGRRAGKSTLSAELTRRGHPVYSDDVLAIDLDDEGLARGLATGVAPRLRIPLPSNASDRFRNWVHQDPGPSNRQYKYLTDATVAPFGTSRPIGAIVTLDRRDKATEPAFSEMAPDEVLRVLIYQNFGRFSHSGRILSAFSAMARDLPCLRLTYSDFETAADFLEAAVAKGLLAGGAKAGLQPATDPGFDQPPPAFDPQRPYRQRTGFHCVRIGEEAFVSDADGMGIFHLGAGMMPIWVLLEEPMTLEEIIAVMGEIYPDTDGRTLENDVKTGLLQLNDARLIEAAGA